MNHQQRAALLAIVAVALACVAITFVGVTLHAESTPAHADTFAHDVSDSMLAPTVDDSGAAPLVKRPNEQKPQDAQPENAPESQPEATYSPDYVESDYVPETEYYEPYSTPDAVYGNAAGLNSFNGVYEYGGRHETFYSGDGAAYAVSLWVDDDGFYRTESGNYAVAASDFPYGATFEGSQGTCEVVDSGCDDGVTDYCVSGWY